MSANELKLLSAGAVKSGVARLAAEFERTHDARVRIVFEPAPELRRRIAAGEAADVIVLPAAMMDELAREGKILPESRARLGRSRMGVAVHADAATPELADSAAFVKLVRSATEVIYNRASSGLYAVRLLERLGLAQELAARTVVVDSGAAVMERIAAQPPGAVGLAQISEIMVLVGRGCRVKLAAPLPEEIQNVTTYDAAAAAASEQPNAARALARALTSESAKAVFAATGIL